MGQSDDFNPPKKPANSELSATVPDIFASMGKETEIPSETTEMQLSHSGTLPFPGTWLDQDTNKRKVLSTVTYKRKDSISTTVAIGSLDLDQRGGTLVNGLCTGEPRALQDFEIAGLRAALANSRRPNEYEIETASTEMLCDKMVLVIQGFFSREALKESLIIFPDLPAYGFLSFKAIKPEFAMYFNHLRLALKNVVWKR